jgi:hypothetical protein
LILTNIYSLAIWCLTISLVLLSSFTIGRIASLRIGLVWITSIGASLLTLSALWLFSITSTPRPCQVTITSPPNGMEVHGPEITVTGTIAPTTARVTVVVRSETDVRWWVQEILDKRHHSGDWSLTARIGTQQAGLGETYEIVALASDDSYLFNLFTGRFLYHGLRNSAMPLWNQSQLIVLRRVK